MGFKEIYESLVTKFKGNPELVVDDTIDSEALTKADTKELVDFINSIKVSSRSREDLYAEYNKMSEDSVIGSAIELIADDATQEDATQERVVWVTSKNKKIEQELNEYLKTVNMDHCLWKYAYQIIKYGEVYLKTFNSEFSQKGTPSSLKEKLGYYFEIVEDPVSIYNLQQYGDTVGFAVRKSIGNKEKFTVYPTSDYIHVMNDRGISSQTVKIPLKNSDGDVEEVEYRVGNGTSLS